MPLHLFDNTDNNFRVIASDTGNGQAATAIRTYTVSGVDNATAMAFDGTNLHVFDDTDNSIHVFAHDTADGQAATAIRTYTVDGLGRAEAMTFDGTNLHAADFTDDNIRVFAPDHTSGDAADRTYTVSGLGSPTAMTFDGTNLHAADFTDDNIRVFAPDHTSGDAADRTYTVSELNNAVAMTFDGTNLHIGDNLDDNIRVIAPDTADGQAATVLRTYTVSGVDAITSMTYVPDDPNATITLSTTDTDRRGGVAFTVDVDSTIDISDFTIDDVDVTNGTKANFVMTDAQNFSVDITPDAGSGTVTVAIAEDAVTPGNTAVSVNFTYVDIYQLHIADGSNDNISVIGYDTADGDTADALRTYTTTDSTDVQSIVYDGTHIHVTNWQQSTVRVYAINLSGVSPVVRSYTVTGISQPSGMAFDGTHLHIADRASDNIRVIAPDTADNGTATILRTYEVTGLEDCRGMAFDGENIHAADYTDDNIRVFAPDTPDNGTATVIRTYTVRDVNHSRSIAFDGANIHVSDVNDDNFRVVAVPTTGGAQTVLRTYEVTDIGNPRGMTGIPVTTTTQANLTITTTHGDIYAGQSVTFAIASDIDITDFTLSDISTTGASHVSFGTFGERMWRLQVTADDGAGEIVISIAENVVSPGNVAVSETFTRNARITPTIAFSNTDLVPNQQTLATITFPQAVSGLTRADLTLDVGTLGATLTTVSRTVYRIPVTAPSSGSGTMTLTLAEDATTPPNTAVSESVNYTETLVATALEVVSGDGQSAQVGNALANPLVVQVNDQNGDAFAGATVSFTTTGGTLSTASATTGANGQASTSLTLPNTAGEYTVTASVSGLTDVTFTATASAVPLVATTLEIVSGDNQSGVVSTALANDLVVRVLDQNNNAFSGSTVTFSTTGGTLSETSVVTGADGQASTSLTLPAAEGDYTVTASVSGLADVTFTATATQAPNTPPVFGQASYTFRNVMVTVNSGVGTVAATDTETLSYSLTGTDASRFDIDSSGQITVATALANSESYSFNVVADDGMATASVPVTVITASVGIHFQGANRDFPESGYLRVGSELIGYTGIMGSTFTGITRGVLGTTVVDHADESDITYLNFVLQDQDLTGRVVIRADTANIFNVVRNSEGTVEVRDADSIAKFGEKVYTLDLGRLTTHDLQWQETVLRKYLDTLKDLQYLISFDVLPTLGYLRIGDIVGFRYAGLLYTMRIVSLTKSLETINIKGRTV